MSTPNPYSNWSGAPKHWGHIPAQRSHPPSPDQLDDGKPDAEDGAEDGRASRGEWTVAAIALAVAVAAFVLIGVSGGVTKEDTPPPERTNATLVR